MIRFIDLHRDRFGVEPICAVVPIAPSTYFAHAARRADPALLSTRTKQDAVLVPEVQRVYSENFAVYPSLGRLVQPPASLGTDRKRTASGSRGTLHQQFIELPMAA